MINGDKNPFQSAEEQKNDIMQSMSDKFAATNDEINAQNIEDSKKKELLNSQIQTNYFAQQSQQGHETSSSFNDP